MAKSTLLVDLDGTLWDSWPWYADLLAQSSGNSASYFLNRLHAGENIVKLMKENSVSNRVFVNLDNTQYTNLKFYDNVTETLIAVRARKIFVGAVTNLPKWLVSSIVRTTGIDRLVPIIVTPSIGVPAKPNPRGILAALRMIGQVPSSYCWFVGDRSEDADAAAAAKVRFAWVSYGYQIRRPETAEYTLNNFSDVLSLVESTRV